MMGCSKRRGCMTIRLGLIARSVGCALVLLLLIGASADGLEPVYVSPLSESAVSGSIFPGQAFAIGSNSGPMVLGDFDADGLKDIAVLNGGEYNAGASLRNPDLSILYGLGDGTFASEIRIPLGAAPVSIVAGDFDENGTDDLAVGSSVAGKVLAYLAHRDRTFAGPMLYPGG